MTDSFSIYNKQQAAKGARPYEVQAYDSTTQFSQPRDVHSSREVAPTVHFGLINPATPCLIAPALWPSCTTEAVRVEKRSIELTRGGGGMRVLALFASMTAMVN